MCLYTCEGESVCALVRKKKLKKNCICMSVRTRPPPSGYDRRCERIHACICAHVPALYHACPLMSRCGGGERHDGSDGGAGKKGAASGKLCHMESACHSVSPRRHPSLSSRATSFIYRPLTLFPLTLLPLPLPPPRSFTPSSVFPSFLPSPSLTP